MDKTEFFKYHKIKILGDSDNEGILDNKVEITEKVDMTNTRVGLFGEQIVFGSRNRELELGDEKMFDKIFYHIKETLKDKKDEILEIQSEFGNLILFGEGRARHTIGYDFDKMPPILGFDIYSFKLNKYLPSKIRRNLFSKLGLTNIHQIFVGKVKDKNKLEIPKSVYYNGLSEGIVLKSETSDLKAKLVREEFKEAAKLTFGPNKKFAEDDTELFIATYCLNPRIEKIIFKQLDEGNKLEMQLMASVPKLVHKDIWEENWEEICGSNLTVDNKKIRKRIYHRVLSVLQQMITNNAL